MNAAASTNVYMELRTSLSKDWDFVWSFFAARWHQRAQGDVKELLTTRREKLDFHALLMSTVILYTNYTTEISKGLL